MSQNTCHQNRVASYHILAVPSQTADGTTSKSLYGRVCKRLADIVVDSIHLLYAATLL